MNHREMFLRHVAQTSTAPLAIEVVRAEGMLMWDEKGKEYLDIIGGISVCSVGHRHPEVIKAIHTQADLYLHVMVYGELVQSPQVQFAAALAAHLPLSLDAVYFTGSGSEATEGAMKLAKRVTGRTEIVAFKDSYHGSTQGALSVMGDEYWRNAFRPLLPGISHENYGEMNALERITSQTAMVIAETVQAEKGVNVPTKEWMQALRRRCDETGTLLVLDEIQVGFGRTGSLWAFEQFDIVPDILLLGKALGGGLPLGAFVAKQSMMNQLAVQPVLGHITTFGGHPLSCAAGLAAFNVLIDEHLYKNVKEKAALFASLLIHPKIKAVRTFGLLIAVEFDNFDQNKAIIDACIEKGIFTDWFLFASNCMRIAPPLIINEVEIRRACAVILEVVGSC
jgi:acetylornithine/succinyldiaminopimelate/putrescine aminotransferase